MNNDIPQPRFSVGEQVVLQPSYFPEIYGQIDTVDLSYFVSNQTTVSGNTYTGWVYKLEIGAKDCIDFVESALRKKHDGSEFTFDQLMSTIKQPCNV